MTDENFFDDVNDIINGLSDEEKTQLKKFTNDKMMEVDKELKSKLPEIIRFISMDRESLIVHHCKISLLDEEYFNSKEFGECIDTALKMTQLIRLLKEEMNF